MFKRDTMNEKSTDRLSLTTAIAIALHAAVIFGIGFNYATEDSSKEINVTLANQPSELAPETADFLAQFNQEGSGTEQEAKKITTDQRTELNDSQINEVTPPPQVKQQNVQTEEQAVITAIGAADKVNTSELTNDNTDSLPGNAPETISAYNTDIASLEAEYALEKQAFAKQPKVKRLTQVSAKASDDAQYLYDWTQRVEAVANENFPREALEQKITGSLVVLCVLNPDGHVEHLEVLESSGHNVLDAAALQAVRASAPFRPFPASIREAFDRIEIIRTYNFSVKGFSTSE